MSKSYHKKKTLESAKLSFYIQKTSKKVE